MRKKSLWQAENTSGFEFDQPWKWLMLPGVVIQWITYIFPSGSYGSSLASTRAARSQLMTYLYSIGFYCLVALLLLSTAGRN